MIATSRTHARGPRRDRAAGHRLQLREGEDGVLGQQRVRARRTRRPSSATTSPGSRASSSSACPGSSRRSIKLCDVDTSQVQEGARERPLPDRVRRPGADELVGAGERGGVQVPRQGAQRRRALRVGQRRRDQAGRQHPAARLPGSRRDGRRPDGARASRARSRPRRTRRSRSCCARAASRATPARSRPSRAPTSSRRRCGPSGWSSSSAARAAWRCSPASRACRPPSTRRPRPRRCSRSTRTSRS